MSENVPFTVESFSQPNNPDFINILNTPAWAGFCQAVRSLELAVAGYDPKDDTNAETMASQSVDLFEIIGDEYKGARCKVSGLAYNIDTHEIDTEPIFLNSDDVTLSGVDICYRHGKWQAMLEFYHHAHTKELPNGTYLMPPDSNHLMDLKINLKDQGEKSDEDLVKMLHNDIESLRAFIQTKSFKKRPPEQQREFLLSVTTNIDDEVPHEYRDQDVEITCSQYYTIYDGMPNFDIRQFFSDHSNMPVTQFPELTGAIITFEFPELASLPPDSKLNPKTLSLNNGAYCLVLRNEDDRATYYILPQTIVHITTA
jgi:hypothetical protein